MAALRYGNMHGDNNNNLIGCRICDCIFMSRKDLFDHIELHFLFDESEAKRKLLLSHMPSTSHPPEPPTQQQDWRRPRLSLALSRVGYVPSTLPPGEINRNPFSTGAYVRNLDQRSTVGQLPVSFKLTGNNSVPTQSREININPFSIGDNARNLDRQLTVGPLPVSFQSTAIRNNSISTPPRGIDINPFSIGANARNLDQKLTVRPLPVSFQSTIPTPPKLVYAQPQIMREQQHGVEHFTRPFLHQLETSLLVDGMASIDKQIDGVAGNQQELDVTLKI
ncbi:hypothetical protein V6N13_104350 [Hibiscus sabdariffa]|uniref:C2H2-type domain-containing protein n=2 Tax=Hibiscus sabdariffa TaxID=183260 RepID=A0ABR2DI35_9ROSI